MAVSSVPRNRIALAALCLAALMFSLEISSVPVILPVLEKVLHGDFKGMQWIMNAYTIACTTVLMATGTLADRYGRRLVFILSLILFGVASLICGLAPSTPLLIASRFLQGMGGGAMLICLTAILSHQFQAGRDRSMAFAMWGIVLGIGLGFGPIIGAVIVALATWQWVFLVHVPLTVLTLALTLVGVRESRDPQAERLDILGIVTLSVAVFGLAYFITQGPDLGFTSLAALLILAAAAISFLLFILVERMSARPMFDFSVFRIRNFSGAIMGSIGMNFSFWPFIIYLPIYFQAGLGYDTVAAGAALLAYTLPTLFVPPLAERLMLRYQARVVIPGGLFVIGLGFILMMLGTALDHANWLTMLPGCIVAGSGLGLTNTPVTNTTTGSVSMHRTGMASGIDVSARLITLAINIALMGVILVAGVASSLADALPGVIEGTQLRLLAETIAAGDLDSLRQGMPGLSSAVPTDAAVHAALMHGFGLVMLYGALGVWALAAASFVIFGRRRHAALGCPMEEAC